MSTTLVGGCRGPANRGRSGQPATLTIGVGQVHANPQFGMQQVAALLSLEGLAILGGDGKSRPLLAAGWNLSSDGRVLKIQLRPFVVFHDQAPVDSGAVRSVLERELKKALGPIGKTIRAIRAVSNLELEIDLEERVNFVTDALDLQIHSPSSPSVGTGPFFTAKTTPTGIEMSANRKYYLGPPKIDTVLLKPYESFRGAWADMLRGHLDMLYEIGLQGLNSLQPASNVRVFITKRPYAYLIVLNLGHEEFQSKVVRLALNQAINRTEVVSEALSGHASPTDGPIWPDHWAYDPTFAHIRFEPATAEATIHRTYGSGGFRFVCLVAATDPYERIALTVQRQLKAVGVDMDLEAVSNDQLVSRLGSGDFQAILVDARIAPSLFQEYQWWYSNGPRNFGGYKSATVDTALDTIHTAPDDLAYRRGVASFQKAIIEDPPAIFLAWSERARALSTRFQVPADVSPDVLSSFSSIRLFKPVTDVTSTGRN